MPRCSMSLPPARRMARLTIPITGIVSVLTIAHAKGLLDDSTGSLIFGIASFITGVSLYLLFPIHGRTSLWGRTPKTLNEIYLQFFAGSSIQFEDFMLHWTNIARLLNESPEILLPGDRFEQELSPQSPLDRSNEKVFLYYQSHQSGLHQKIDARNIQTIGELIQTLAAPKQQ